MPTVLALKRFDAGSHIGGCPKTRVLPLWTGAASAISKAAAAAEAAQQQVCERHWHACRFWSTQHIPFDVSVIFPKAHITSIYLLCIAPPVSLLRPRVTSTSMWLNSPEPFVPFTTTLDMISSPHLGYSVGPAYALGLRCPKPRLAERPYEERALTSGASWQRIKRTRSHCASHSPKLFVDLGGQSSQRDCLKQEARDSTTCKRSENLKLHP